MPPNPEMRASDADRDRVAALLRENCAQGRITIEELEERLEAAYSARTIGQLQEVTSDLPEEDLYELPVPASQRAPLAGSSAPVARTSGGGDVVRAGTRAVWATWAAVSGINFAIWLVLVIAGVSVYPWWIWVAGPWGAILAISTVLGRQNRD
jgi:hypothetical protein